MYGEFACASAEEIAACSNVIAQIEQLEKLEALFTDRVFFHVDLQPLAALLQVSKRSFPHEAKRHDAPRNAYVRAVRLELLGGLGGIVRDYLRDGVREVEAARIAFLPEGLNLFELSAAEFVDVVVESQTCPL